MSEVDLVNLIHFSHTRSRFCTVRPPSPAELREVLIKAKKSRQLHNYYGKTSLGPPSLIIRLVSLAASRQSKVREEYLCTHCCERRENKWTFHILISWLPITITKWGANQCVDELVTARSALDRPCIFSTR